MVGVLVIAALVAASCSDDDDPSATPSATSTTEERASTSAAPTTSEDPDPTQSIAEAWADAWSAAGMADATEADVPLSSAAVGERLVATLHPERGDGELADVAREVTSTPTISASPDGPDTFVVDDCLLIFPPVAAGQANYYRGTASVDPDSGEVTIETVEPASITGCVSKPVAAEVLAAYDEYWDAVTAISNPPDPSSPRLAEVTTGDQRDLLTSSLADFAARDLIFIDDPGRHPEITEWRNATTVVLLDCQEADTDYGLFDAAGNRQPETSAVSAGEVDLREFTMVLEDDRWKVTDRQGSSDTDCSFAPTEFGVPVV
ncbi:MAG: hypothetical protein OSA99_13020 [Acidimicrobiales bacterium]|nr:hypothetical protein [Acidimicrobiales bacterium]